MSKLAVKITCPACREALAEMSYVDLREYKLHCRKCGMTARCHCANWAEAQAHFESLPGDRLKSMEQLKEKVCTLLDYKRFWDAIKVIKDAFAENAGSNIDGVDEESNAQGLTEDDYEF